MVIDLSGPRAKVTRAHEHSDSLEATIGPVVGKANQIQVRAERDSQTQTGDYIFRVVATPDEWRLRVGVLIGEAVHKPAQRPRPSVLATILPLHQGA